MFVLLGRTILQQLIFYSGLGFDAIQQIM